MTEPPPSRPAEPGSLSSRTAEEATPPGLAVAVVASTLSAVALGAFVGYAVRSDPDAVVATVLLLVGLFDLLGAIRFAAGAADLKSQAGKIVVYRECRTAAKDPQPYDEKIEGLRIKQAEFTGALVLLPQLIITTFGLVMAAAAYAWG